jgi:hypothetical protein
LTDDSFAWTFCWMVDVNGFPFQVPNLNPASARMVLILAAGTFFWAAHRARLPDAKNRRALSLAIALIGFGVFVWRLLGLG